MVICHLQRRLKRSKALLEQPLLTKHLEQYQIVLIYKARDHEWTIFKIILIIINPFTKEKFRHHQDIHKTVPFEQTCSNFDMVKIFVLKDITVRNNRDRQCCHDICNLTPLSWISGPICNSSASYRARLQKHIKIKWKQRAHTKLTEVSLGTKRSDEIQLGIFYFLFFLLSF